MSSVGCDPDARLAALSERRELSAPGRFLGEAWPPPAPAPSRVEGKQPVPPPVMVGNANQSPLPGVLASEAWQSPPWGDCRPSLGSGQARHLGPLGAPCRDMFRAGDSLNRP